MDEEVFFTKISEILDEKLKYWFEPIMEYIETWKQTATAIKETELVATKTTKKQKQKADRMICDVKLDYETEKAWKIIRKEDGMIKWVPKKYIQSTITLDDGWSEITLTAGGAWISNKPWEEDQYNK